MNTVVLLGFSIRTVQHNLPWSVVPYRLFVLCSIAAVPYIRDSYWLVRTTGNGALPHSFSHSSFLEPKPLAITPYHLPQPFANIIYFRPTPFEQSMVLYVIPRLAGIA